MAAHFRVHADGLSQTERKVFAGIIRLAERIGTVFQIEEQFENCDIVILDGTDHSSFASTQADGKLSRRAIWIDPPEAPASGRAIKRPLNWSSLLAMMEEIAAESGAAAGHGGTSPLDRYCSIAERVLRAHIGIAAEFVVTDTRAEIEGGGQAAAVSIDRFLHVLKPQLPSNVDGEAILRQILKVASTGGAG